MWSKRPQVRDPCLWFQSWTVCCACEAVWLGHWGQAANRTSHRSAAQQAALDTWWSDLGQWMSPVRLRCPGWQLQLTSHILQRCNCANPWAFDPCLWSKNSQGTVEFQCQEAVSQRNRVLPDHPADLAPAATEEIVVAPYTDHCRTQERTSGVLWHRSGETDLDAFWQATARSAHLGVLQFRRRWVFAADGSWCKDCGRPCGTPWNAPNIAGASPPSGHREVGLWWERSVWRCSVCGSFPTKS